MTTTHDEPVDVDPPVGVHDVETAALYRLANDMAPLGPAARDRALLWLYERFRSSADGDTGANVFEPADIPAVGDVIRLHGVDYTVTSADQRARGPRLVWNLFASAAPEADE